MNFDAKVALAVSTARLRCVCESCDDIVGSALILFICRANRGEIKASLAALDIITAGIYPYSISSYQESTRWMN